MGKLTMTRRTFIKAAAVTGAAAMLAGASTALAEDFNTKLRGNDPANTADVVRVRTACRGCGKCECGVFVTVRDGKAIKIEGDESAYHVNGNCCTKSQSSIECVYHPDRLLYPMKRTNPRGDNENPGWVRISYDEAYATITEAYTTIREKYGETAAVSTTGTSRFWAMGGGTALGAFFKKAQATGAAEICKGPRRCAGSLTIENGIFFHATVDYPLVYVQWGTEQTQSNYDDSCRMVSEAARRANYFISVDPRKSNNGKDATHHLALYPGTDHEMILGWTRIVLEKELYDDYIVRYWSNAPFLYCKEIERGGVWAAKNTNKSKGFVTKTRLLKESDIIEGGSGSRYMVWNEATDSLTWFDSDEDIAKWEGETDWDIPTTGWEYERGGVVLDYPKFRDDLLPAVWGEYPVTLKDGRQVKCKTVMQTYWDDVVSEWTLDRVAEVTTCDAKLIEDAVLTWATRIDPRRGNGGINAQLAPEQCGNNIQFFRACYILFAICDCYDVPGSNRGMTRTYVNAGVPSAVAKLPKVFSEPKWNSPLLNSTEASSGVSQGTVLGANASSTTVNATPDANWVNNEVKCGMKEFPMERWWGTTPTNEVWHTCVRADPYPVKGYLAVSGDIMNQSNTHYAWEALMQMDFAVAWDLWHIVMCEGCDILLPVQHWLELDAWPRISQGSTGATGANMHSIAPRGEAKFDLWQVHDFYKAAGKNYFPITEACPTGFDADYVLWLDAQVQNTGMNWYEYADRFATKGWRDMKVEQPLRWGHYRRYMYGYMRQADGMVINAPQWQPGTATPTMKIEIWSTIQETYCSVEMPTTKASKFLSHLTSDSQIALPYMDGPRISKKNTPELFTGEYPFMLTTGRRIPVYFHSEHRQLPMNRELWPAPRLDINAEDAAELGIEQGDWVWIENHMSKIREIADLSYTTKRGVLNAEHTWWFPEFDADNPKKGFDLCCINCLVDHEYGDPWYGSSQLRAYPVKIYKATPENSPFGNPCPCDVHGNEIIHDASDPRLKEWRSRILEIQENNGVDPKGANV